MNTSGLASPKRKFNIGPTLIGDAKNETVCGHRRYEIVPFAYF